MLSIALFPRRINFLKSRLIFESFSDSSRDVDLVSREILLSDLRFDDFPANLRANVFTQILQPMQMAKRKSPLQAEVHLRATQVKLLSKVVAVVPLESNYF